MGSIVFYASVHKIHYAQVTSSAGDGTSTLILTHGQSKPKSETESTSGPTNAV